MGVLGISLSLTLLWCLFVAVFLHVHLIHSQLVCICVMSVCVPLMEEERELILQLQSNTFINPSI